MSAKRHWASNMRLSHHGAAFIAREEGVRTSPYQDSEGWATTGVGHLITPRHKGITAHDRHAWTFHSPREAIEYFRKVDVVQYERAVRAVLGQASLTQAQYDAVICLTFNIGAGGFASSSVARYIKAGKMRAAADAFLMWDRPAVLRGRRERERSRFLAAHW